MSERKETGLDAKAVHDLRFVSRLLRDAMLRWWKRKVVCSYVSWMKDKYSLRAPSLSDNIVAVNLGGEGHEWYHLGRERYERTKEGRDRYKKFGGKIASSRPTRMSSPPVTL